MDWITGMQKAIDYIEDNLIYDLDYSEISKRALVSSFHFQRVFSILCGYTVGEYIRKRRLTLAGVDLTMSDIKVIDVALKYRYETPESFTKAFSRFHGITPRAAREPGAKIKSFCRLSIKISLEGGDIMDYRIEKKNALAFVGYKKKFIGELGERFDQERDFWVNTRKEQDVLMEMRNEPFIWYDINTNFSDEGYDHYIAVLSDKEITEGFEKITVSELTYAIFETERMNFPTSSHLDLRKKIVSEWLPSSEYILAEGPEITVTHWFKKPEKEKRYIELWIPVEKKI
ncbi:AraC family transcriptional regulator [Clostridium pasteurianum]|uniref:DNA-binding domain-containing protein, AraC-type n=1 Tax=Clostridium pasteurianum BC1 TaxID=86416 RepID=R4JZH2_CLOPA|nr:helix-turn-helix domain-containing protein [Clostridium pasteurianum]AGK95708.1 DNA-binding domain-containing protein, AraC-type [Clostridium pasteurianum BC1]